jgi:hypothetical protein
VTIGVSCVGVFVGVGVLVEVGVSVGVGVTVGVDVSVGVGVRVLVDVAVGVWVIVGVNVTVGGTGVGVSVGGGGVADAQPVRMKTDKAVRIVRAFIETSPESFRSSVVLRSDPPDDLTREN